MSAQELSPAERATVDRIEQAPDALGLREEVQAALEAHTVEDYSEGEFDGDASLLCLCHFVAYGSDLYDAGVAHREHVADAIAAQIGGTR